MNDTHLNFASINQMVSSYGEIHRKVGGIDAMLLEFSKREYDDEPTSEDEVKATVFATKMTEIFEILGKWWESGHHEKWDGGEILDNVIRASAMVIKPEEAFYEAVRPRPILVLTAVKMHDLVQDLELNLIESNLGSMEATQGDIESTGTKLFEQLDLFRVQLENYEKEHTNYILKEREKKFK